MIEIKIRGGNNVSKIIARAKKMICA